MQSSGLSSSQIKKFRKLIYGHYALNGRDLPWRATVDPYRIIVSEIMLQQTQVQRVLEKYAFFIRRFPTVKVLAKASLSDILQVWQGLGYNRRALALKKLAQAVISEPRGRIPSDRGMLQRLPGIGQATSASICAFAFNQPIPFIETNIRSVFLHCFFPGQENVGDEKLLKYVSATLDKKNPRKWYNALMDYGAYLKGNHPNPGRKSLHYKKQGSFAGSNRQIRGAILKILLKKKKMSEGALMAQLRFDKNRIKAMIGSLLKEGLIQKVGVLVGV